MTDKEKAIVMAHTGICMLTGEKYGVFHTYIEDIMGRPVYTHELATQSISDEIKEKSRDDFIKLCMEEQEPCSDAISRQTVNTLIDELARAISDERCCISRGRSTATIMRDILHLPSVTPQQKIGRWIAYEVRLPDRTILNYRCSVCGRKLIGYNTETLSEAPFCHCGAKMVEPQESEVQDADSN